jgi:hypothetical protein
MITAARPITMVPMPMEMSEPPWVCANSAPARPPARWRGHAGQRGAAGGTPWARAMRALAPVARMARPRSGEEPVQQQLGPHHDQQHQRAGHVVGHPFRLQHGEDGRLVISGTLGAPMTRRLIEYSAIIIRILASRSMIFRRTFSQPVMKPASAPASSATKVAERVDAGGDQVAATAPPSGSCRRRSGRETRMRKEISTPSATRLKIRPISRRPAEKKKDF